MNQKSKWMAVALAVGTLAAVALPANAADPAATHAMAGVAHGGQLRMAGPWHLELVVDRGDKGVRERPIVVHVTDHGGKPVATAGGSGKATLRSAAGAVEVALRPDGPNRLKGVAKYAADPATTVTVGVSLPGHPAEQAKFAPFAGH